MSAPVVVTSHMPPPGVVRDRLAREHYDRLRRAVLPTLGHLPQWADLTEAGREPYRRHVEYLVPAVLELAGGAA